MYQSSYKSSDYYRKTREVYTGNMSLSEVTDDLNTTTDENAKDAVRVFLTRMNRRFISSDVITSDAIILDHCGSWVNVTEACLRERGVQPYKVWG